MFARVASALFFALPLLTSATAIVARQDPPATAAAAAGGGGPAGNTVNQCNTGELNCCQSVQSPTSKDAITTAGLLGIVLDGITVPVGLNCDPISAIVGLGANSCSAQPACCTGNNFGGLITLACDPINLTA